MTENYIILDYHLAKVIDSQATRILLWPRTPEGMMGCILANLNPDGNTVHKVMKE